MNFVAINAMPTHRNSFIVVLFLKWKCDRLHYTIPKIIVKTLSHCIRHNILWFYKRKKGWWFCQSIIIDIANFLLLVSFLRKSLVYAEKAEDCLYALLNAGSRWRRNIEKTINKWIQYFLCQWICNISLQGVYTTSSMNTRNSGNSLQYSLSLLHCRAFIAGILQFCNRANVKCKCLLLPYYYILLLN